MGWKHYTPSESLVMIACQFVYAAVILVTKKALSQDMSSLVFVVYRQFIAFLLLAPLAFFTRRGRTRVLWDGRTSGSYVCYLSSVFILILDLLSFLLTCGNYANLLELSYAIYIILNMNLYIEGLNLVSSSAASALFNLVPAITFIMAFTIGLEKLHLPSARSVAKIIGTVVCVSGAIVIVLLKDPKLLNDEFLPIRHAFLHGDHNQWLLGCLLVFGSSCSWSLWLILQGLGAAVTYLGQLWCVERRGPLFSAMFQPLSTVIVTLFACIFQHEELYMGSFIGSLAVIAGLYIVLWSKAKDHEDVNAGNDTTLSIEVSDNQSSTIDLKEPLLPGN
ncbi:UNVERIFIED_CONTAM: WAT1-related protein [Sesamum latifolium]|uniref:WAT1-related protein n=1 Tax=Sesamum latifolium TaxID=2727402 RepID=A0AAW2XTH6_9LAMI